VFFSILHRTIFLELARIFVLSLLGITGILVMAGLVAEATQQGLSPTQILMVIPLLIPSTLPYTIPTTTLFATCLVYGRLAHDNEILAIKSAGVNILYVIWPGIFLGMLMSCVTLAMYIDLIPYTHYMLRARVLKDVEDYMYTLLKKDGYIKQSGLNYSIFVRNVQDKRLIDPVFKRQTPTGEYDVIATAREAYLHVETQVDPKPQKEVRILRVVMHHCQVFGNDKEDRGYFDEKDWPVALPDELLGGKKTKPRAMCWHELDVHKRELIEERDRYAEQLAVALARYALDNPPATLHEHIQNLKSVLYHRNIEIRCIDAEKQMRPALSFGCLFFVLIGCPVGIWFSRNDYLSAFIACFLPIVLVYYPLLLCSTNFAKDGRLPAFVAMWLANGLMALIAPVLFYNLMKN
jgi:lipopolysaccharide export system permease protein